MFSQSAELLAKPRDDAIDETGEAVSEPRLQRRLGAAADRDLGLGELKARQLRGPRGERLDRDLEPGGDDAAEVLTVGGDGVEVDRRPEVDRQAAAADLLVSGDGVDEPV